MNSKIKLTTILLTGAVATPFMTAPVAPIYAAESSASLLAQRDTVKKAITTVTNAMNTKAAEVTEASTAVTLKSQEVKAADANRATKETALTNLQAEVLQMTNDYNQKLDDHDTAIKKAETNMIDAKNELDVVEGPYTLAQELLDEAKLAYENDPTNENEENLNSAQAMFDTAKENYTPKYEAYNTAKETYDKAVTDKETYALDAKANIAAKGAEVDTAKEEYTAANLAVENLNAEVKALNDVYTTKQAEWDALNNQRQALVDQYNDLTARYEAAAEAEGKDIVQDVVVEPETKPQAPNVTIAEEKPVEAVIQDTGTVAVDGTEEAVPAVNPYDYPDGEVVSDPNIARPQHTAVVYNNVFEWIFSLIRR